MSDATTITAQVDIDVRIYSVECNERGHGALDIISVEGETPSEITVIVGPCAECLKAAECDQEHVE